MSPLAQFPTAARAAALAACLALAAGLARGESLRIGGTGAALAALARMAEPLAAKVPGLEPQVMPSLGSSGGLRALQQSRIDVAVISRPLTRDESASGLVASPYARTALVFASRRPQPENLTAADVAAILRGDRALWPDGSPLRLVLRPANDTDSTLLATLSPEVAAASARAYRREGLLVGLTDQEAADFIEHVPGALGTASLSLLAAEARPLRIHALEGTVPSTESVANGRYPLVKTFYLVTRGKAAGPAAQLAAFTASPEGLRLLARLGHAPAR